MHYNGCVFLLLRLCFSMSSHSVVQWILPGSRFCCLSMPWLHQADQRIYVPIQPSTDVTRQIWHNCVCLVTSVKGWIGKKCVAVKNVRMQIVLLVAQASSDKTKYICVHLAGAKLQHVCCSPYCAFVLPVSNRAFGTQHPCIGCNVPQCSMHVFKADRLRSLDERLEYLKLSVKHSKFQLLSTHYVLLCRCFVMDLAVDKMHVCTPWKQMKSAPCAHVHKNNKKFHTHL